MQEFKTADIRKAFKAIGYKITFRNHPLTDGLCYIGFKPDAADHGFIMVGSAMVMGADTYNTHKAAFELAAKYRGQWVIERHQKIA